MSKQLSFAFSHFLVASAIDFIDRGFEPDEVTKMLNSYYEKEIRAFNSAKADDSTFPAVYPEEIVLSLKDQGYTPGQDIDALDLTRYVIASF